MKKRIVLLLSVVALMVVMLATSVAPALASWDPMTGCREGDELVPVESLPPEAASIDGKRFDDGFVCLHISGQSRVHVYDNRPQRIPI
jgi:hypothetical protein